MSEPSGAMGAYLRSLHLGVRNLDESMAFYGEALGLPVEQDSEAGLAVVSLSCGTRLLLDQELGERLQVGPHFAGGAPHVHLHLEVTDVEGVMERLANQGHPVDHSVEQTAGLRIFVTADPDGHNLQIFQGDDSLSG
jgi:predicted enzyme related to lactoylglutathione lyase